MLPYPPSLKSYLYQTPIFPHPKSHASCVFSSLFLVFPDSSLLLACLSLISPMRNFYIIVAFIQILNSCPGVLGCVGTKICLECMCSCVAMYPTQLWQPKWRSRASQEIYAIISYFGHIESE